MLLPTLLAAVPAAILQGDVQDLGTPTQASGETVVVTGLSADGTTVIGAASLAPGLAQGFRWTEIEGYESLRVPFTARGVASHVSDDGGIVVGTSFESTSVIWNEQGQGSFVNGLPLVNSQVLGLSGDGTTVIGTGVSIPTQNVAYVWTATGGMQELGDLGGALTEPQAISADGQAIVGTGQDAQGLYRAFRWAAATGIADLGAPATPLATSVDVSADGLTIAGSYRDASGSGHVFQWTVLGGYADLGGPGSPFVDSVHLSRDGSVIVGTASFFTTPRRGFRWTAASGFAWTNLPTGEEFLPSDLSGDGSVVVGHVTIAGSGALPVRWSTASGYEVLDGIVGAARTSAKFVSDAGEMIAGESEGAAQVTNGLLWRSDGMIGMTDCRQSDVNSTGFTGKLALLGSNSIANGAMTLAVSDLPPGTSGFFLASRLPGFNSNPALFQGTLCLSGQIGRFVGPGQIRQADASGVFSLTVDPGALPTPLGPVLPMSGERWYFQAWHRDANPTLTSNFTDSVAVRIY